MKMLSLAAALCLSAASAASAGAGQRAAVTPVEKVLQLLNDLLANGKSEKHEEEVDFAKFQVWCQSTESATTKSINAGGKQIRALSADIEKAKADAELLAKEISDLQAASAQDSADADAAKAVRDKEKADYEAQNQDFSESIDACKRAIEVLKARSADVPQSLLQVRKLQKLPGVAKAALDQLLEFHAQAVQGPPQANAYEFQSGSVVQILEKLTTDFQDQRLALEKSEMAAKASFEQLLEQLTNNVDALKKSAAKKTGEKASRIERASTATGEKQSTEANKAQDEKTLADTLAECQIRSASFEKDQVTRSGEIQALESAIEILSGSSVSGHSETYLPQLLQTKARGSALVQLRSRALGAPEVRRKVVEFLQAHAGKINSRYLALVAARVAEDPFAKVTQMIKELITKLTEEANSEADHHAYCTSELAMNKQSREDKSAEADELAAKLDRLTSDGARLAGEAAALSEALAELRSKQGEAAKLRSEEHAINVKTIADAQEAQNAVTKATQVLKDFYGKAKDPSLLQGMAQAMAPYKGQQSGSTGVFGLLEVILSDFARLEASTVSAEDSAQTAFEKFTAESNQDVAVKDTTLEHTEDAKRRTDENALDTKKQLSLTQQELESASEYFETLKADCLDTGLSYEDRVKAREEEVKSLQEALVMLDQQDLA